MAHRVFLSTGITSHINAYCQLAARFMAQGDRVSFVCARKEGEELLTSRGFSCVFLPEEAEHNRQRWRPIRPLAGIPGLRSLYRIPGVGRLLPWLNPFAQWRRARQRSDFIRHSSELDECLQRLAPDAVLVVSEWHHAILRCMGQAWSTTVLETHVSTRRMAGIPVLSSTLMPDAGAEACARSWDKVLRKRRLGRALARVALAGLDEDSALRRLARARGIDFHTAVDLGQWQLYDFPLLPKVHLSAAEFDFPPTQSVQLRYAGPQVYQPRSELSATDSEVWAPWLKERRSRRRPLVLCAMGSFASHQDKAFLRRVVAAAALRPDWRFLIATGQDIEAQDLLPPDVSGASGTLENVGFFPRLPLLKLLPKAALIITHGGIATMNESIINQVPMIIYSSGFLDRNGNAARVEFHGLGLRGNLQHDDPETIASTAQRVLEEPSFQLNLRRMAEAYQRYQQIPLADIFPE